MTLSCEEVRARIVDEDDAAELRAHVDGCLECRSVLAALEEVDGTLAALGPLDAPDALVDKTLAAVRAESPETTAATFAAPPAKEERQEKPREDVEAPSLLAAALAMLGSALGALVTAPVLLVRWLLGVGTPPRPPSASRDASSGESAPRRFGLGPAFAMASLLVVVGLMTWRSFGATVKTKIRGADEVVNGLPTSGDGWQSPAAPIAASAPEEREDVPTASGSFGRRGGLDHHERGELGPMDPATSADLLALGYAASQRGPTTGEGQVALDGDDEIANGEIANAEADRGIYWRDESGADDGSRAPVGATATLLPRAADQDRTVGDFEERPATAPSEPMQGLRGQAIDGLLEGAQRQGPSGVALDQSEIDGRFASDDLQARLTLQERPPIADVPAAWLAAHATTGLAFAPSEGWWSNTYVPGDASLRMLHARLAASTTPLAGGASALALAESASPTTPAVAAPTDRAIAIGVHADTAAIEGPTRVRVEIALRAIEQAAGRRGALRIALVVDGTSGLGEPETEHLRSLLAALSRSLTPRDRVVLTAAGPAGGTLVPLGVLRHGQVEVALRHLASASTITGEQIPVSLSDALASGLEAVSAEDDGAGLALLVTPSGAHDASVDQALHLGAVAGVPTTAIGIGTAASTASLDAIALAGEGRRRLVLGDDDAARVVREELVQASRLVARALRVGLRLAEGVQLVDIVGSHALDQEETRRTRESERAIDQSLARRLGIGQDRDDDDSGVRILVPSFYAGDSHTIVLDLLVARPGPVLDVDVRFKDLVRLGNGTASSALALEAGTAPRGPHELRVIASWLGHDTAAALEEAAADVDRGDVASARARLVATRTLVDQARAEVPGLSGVASTTTDRALLDRFVVALDGATDRPIVAASLHYAAARRQLVPQLQASTP
ncbi:MAG: hypothetical protein U0234_30530 [Sandaracinus sp.]